MSGDWIKMRCELQTHPKIVRILSAMRPHDVQTKTDKFRVVGGLHAVWTVFDTHSIDGVLFGYTPETLDHVIGWEGFSQAMISVGWMLYDGAETLALPEFDEHNGKSAKRRAEDQKRKRSERNADKNPQYVQDDGGQSADKKRTREEKRREEEKHMSDAASDVLAHLNEKAGRKFEAVPSNTKLIAARMREGATLEQLKAVVDAKVRDWANDPKMCEYLRPATLFNAEKFGQYVGSLGAAPVNGQETSIFG